MSLQQLSQALKHMAGKHPQKTHDPHKGDGSSGAEETVAGIPLLETVSDISNSKGSKGFFITRQGKVLPVVHADHWTTAQQVRKSDPQGVHLGEFDPQDYESKDMYKSGVLTGSYIPKNYEGKSELNVRVGKFDKASVAKIKKLMKSGVLPTTDIINIDSMDRYPGYYSTGHLSMDASNLLKTNTLALVADAAPSKLMKMR